MAYPDQNKLNYMATRPIPTMPQMPTKESPWAKRRRAQLMTRMEDQGPAMLGPQFLQYQHNPMSGQRAAAIASRDLGTDYQQELPNFTAQDATDYAMQNAAPDFIKSRLATEEVGRDLPYKQLEQQGSQFTQGMAFNREQLAQNYKIASEKNASDMTISDADRKQRQTVIDAQAASAKAEADRQDRQRIYQEKMDAFKTATNENLTPEQGQFAWDLLGPDGQPQQQPEQPRMAPQQAPHGPQYGPRIPQQSTYNAPGMGQQTMTPQSDQMSGQSGYAASRPSFLGGNGLNTFQMNRDNQAMTAVMAQYGLDKYLDPATVDASFGSDSGKPNQDTIMSMGILAKNIQMALERTKGNPAIQQMIRARLQESLLPKLERFDESFTYGMSNPFTTGSDWMFAGGRGKRGQQAVRRIKELLQ
jgi:hypothetical protein